MRHNCQNIRHLYLILLCALLQLQGKTQTSGANDFADSHFHLTNYIQEGTDIRRVIQIMGNRVVRSTLFGIPLQQMWSYQNSGSFGPTYY